MTNRPKQIGTAGETAVTRYCIANGFPGAERLALKGNLDEGDIGLTAGITVEVKAGKAAETASDAQVAAWLAEAEVERVNRRADVCPLVLKRKGKGAANVGQWWAYLPGWAFVYLAEVDPSLAHWQTPRAASYEVSRWALPAVRITLAELTTLLRRAGYGDPL